MRAAAGRLARQWVLRFVAAAVLVTAMADDVATADERRYVELLRQLRCLVCQNQSVADSDAALAQDMRAIVRQMLAEQRSDREIIGFMKARYGDFVHYRPPFQPSTWLLWLSPFVVFIVAVAAIRWRRRMTSPPPLSSAQRQHVDALLEEDGTTETPSSHETGRKFFR